MKKNKAVLTFMIFFFICINISKGQGNIQAKDRINNQIEALKEDYFKAHGKDSIKYMKLFFISFPTNFSSFNSIYGYSDKTGPRPLYNLYPNHIDFFCKLISILPDSIYFNRLINLGINGYWEADAVNSLKVCIFSHVNEKPGLTLTLLNQFKEKEIRSFWRFLFDGPHPDNKNVKRKYDALHENVRLIDQKMADLMKDEYLKLVRIRNKQH